MGKGISASQLLWTVGYLALAIIICMVVMAWIRKRYMAIEKKNEATFTLPELRALKKIMTSQKKNMTSSGKILLRHIQKITFLTPLSIMKIGAIGIIIKSIIQTKIKKK